MRALLAAVVVALSVLQGVAPVQADEAARKRKAAQTRANRAAAALSRAQTAAALAGDGVAELDGRLRAARGQLAEHQGHMRTLALYRYMRGGARAVPAHGGDINRLARAQALLRFASLSTADAVERYRASRRELEDLQGDRLRSLKARRQALAALENEERQAMKDLERLAAAEKAEQARRAAEARRAADLAAAGGSRAGRAGGGVVPTTRPTGGKPLGPASVATSGPWTCPVQGPHSFSNDYGAPRGGGRGHQGNDLLAPRGTPVVANVGGSVDQHPNRLGGLAYYLHGDDGKKYYGAHLDSFGASGRVSMGTVIGYVGDSGDAVGGPTHLHFEILEGGVAVNPYPTLVKYC